MGVLNYVGGVKDPTGACRLHVMEYVLHPQLINVENSCDPYYFVEKLKVQFF